MSTKEPRVKPIRLLMLFGIVYVGLVVLGFLAVGFVKVQPTLSAIGWHIRHGNDFVLEGHTFHLPLRWDCTLRRYREWELSEDHPLSGGETSIDISSTGKVMSVADIRRFQAAIFAGVHGTQVPTTGVIHAKRFDYLCMTGPVGWLLYCKIPDTDIDVGVTALGGNFEEAQSILKSAD